jgi:hypothetical protein
MLARQTQREESAVGVELLKVGIGERHDLGQERVDAHERGQRRAELLTCVVIR